MKQLKIVAYFIMISFLDLNLKAEKISPNENRSTVWLAPESSKQLTNPISKNKSSIKQGSKIFKIRCIVCHGSTGVGDGSGSKALNPKPANLQSDRVQNQLDGEIFWKMSEGKGAMIAWKHIISEEDRWRLVNFIRTLNKK